DPVKHLASGSSRFHEELIATSRRLRHHRQYRLPGISFDGASAITVSSTRKERGTAGRRDLCAVGFVDRGESCWQPERVCCACGIPLFGTRQLFNWNGDSGGRRGLQGFVLV